MKEQQLYALHKMYSTRMTKVPCNDDCEHCNFKNEDLSLLYGCILNTTDLDGTKEPAWKLAKEILSRQIAK